MSPPERRNPPLGRGGGSRNVHCLAASNTRDYSASPESPEAFAAQIVARRYRLSLPIARLVCDLAAIGARAL
jgi:hypothetical protein